MQRIALALSLSFLAAPAFSQCFAVTTTTVAGNGQSGTMFNVVNISAGAITIGSFDQVFFAAGTSNIEIYTKAGTWQGSETTPGAWTLVGSTAALSFAAAPTLVPIPITVNVPIGPGATQGFYITTTSSTVAYTTGVNQLNTVIGSDPTIQVTCGVGVPYPFGAVFGLPTAGRLWNGTVHYCPAGAGTLATATNYGTGCYQRFGSVYENFLTAGSLDLANTNWEIQELAGSGWLVTTGPAMLPANGISLAMGDDTEVVQALGSNFNGPAGTVNVCSNGFISVGGSNGIAWTPDVPGFLNAAFEAFRIWHDFTPSIVGSGQVEYEFVGGEDVFTWDGVWDFGGTSAANASTIQFRLSGSPGTRLIRLHFGTMSTLGNGFLVGYSPAGASLNPGNTDLSAVVPPLVVAAADQAAIALDAGSRPILGTTVNLTTSNIPAGTNFGVSVLGLAQIPAGIDLGFVGAGGCNQYESLDAVNFFLVGGPTAVNTFNVPNAAVFAGLQVNGQTATLTPGFNPGGILTTNGVALVIGNF